MRLQVALRNVLVRRPTSPGIALLALLCVLPACSTAEPVSSRGVPSLATRKEEQARARSGASSGTVGQVEAGQAVAPKKDEVFYSLAPSALPPGAAPLATQRSTSTPPAATVLGSPLTSNLLVDELQARWQQAWTSSAGSLPENRLALAREGLALAFLRDDHGSGDPSLAEAAQIACVSEAAPDLHLLAAAYQAHHGDLETAAEAVSGLFPSEPGTGDSSDSQESMEEDTQVAASPGLALDHLAFARSIEGPGKFTAALPGDVAPGKSVLVYGEFRDFENEVVSGKGSSSAYRRSFSAALRLVSSEGTEIDRLEFLPRNRGTQESGTPATITNFWARYRIPASLPTGSYRLVIDAEDHVAGTAATGELPFDVSDAALQPASAKASNE